MRKADLLFVCALFAGTSVAGELTTVSLDKLYEQGRYAEATIALAKQSSHPPDVMAWVIQKAQKGVPPFQYEAARLFIDSNPKLGIDFFAKGYIIRSLDLAECTNRGQNPIHMVIGTMYSDTLDKALKNRPEYASAVERAIEWEKNRAQRPSAKWICENFLLPDDKRQEARDKQRSSIIEWIKEQRDKAATN